MSNVTESVSSQTGIEKAKRLAFLRYKHVKRESIGATQVAADRKLLLLSYRCIKNAREDGYTLPRYAEELCDRFYVIEKTLAAMEKEKQKGTVPVFIEGDEHGLARVYCIAREYMKLSCNRVSVEGLVRFITEFQGISPLSQEELCMLPYAIKKICVEILCECAIFAVGSVVESELARKLYADIEKLSQAKNRQRAKISEIVRECAAGTVYILHSMLSARDEYELAKQLVAEYGEERLMRFGEEKRREQNEQHENTLRTITALLQVGMLDWEELTEQLSIIEQLFSVDEVYIGMDMASKKQYAQLVARLAKKLDVTEAAVCRRAVELCEKGDGKAAHVGYYLIDDEGKKLLISRLRPTLRSTSMNAKAWVNIFIWSQLAFALLLLIGIWIADGISYALMVMIPAVTVSNSIFIRLFMRKRAPRFIPKMRVTGTCPNNAKTIVVVPTLIKSNDDVDAILSRIETHYLANPIEGCCFAALCDFPDSPVQWRESELLVLSYARERVMELNKKYSDGENIFYYLHRERMYNSADKRWLGYERKRGAIMQFLELTLDSEKTSPFALISSKLPSDLVYGVVLDSDTIMPRDTLPSLIGAMLHPLNSPVIHKNGIAVEGYSVIAPRMENTAKSADKTAFSRIVSGFSGMSSYSTVTSDLYQDMFGEGIFGGKGIFAIREFYGAVARKIRDNTVLSHDLLEGSLARCGYASDIVLFDGEPSTYLSWWKREHRWVRGDWQLFPYTLPSFIDEDREKYLSALTRWKIFDNMRRSQNIPAILFALLYSIVLGFSWFSWLSVAALIIDPIIGIITSIPRLFVHGINAIKEQGFSWIRAVVSFITLPFGAYMIVDAIVRTIYRMVFSKRKLLEWQTAADSERTSTRTVTYYYRRMLANVIVGLFLVVAPIFYLDGSLFLGIVFLAAPLAMYFVDKPKKTAELTDEHKKEYVELARKIWDFFLEYGSSEYGYTPPDNVQMNPKKPPVFHTSPTNIGMGMMASVCAYDMGFIREGELLTRLKSAGEYVCKLEKWQGHLFNWYDIKTMKKLTPAYVSTVDSGNLACCLLCAAQAAKSLVELTDREAVLRDEVYKTLRRLALGMNFAALFDSKKNLFCIGYDYANGVMSQSYYDMLASEARLTYLVAIALNAIPQKAWFSLSRLLVPVQKTYSLVSWGGTMFEYLMPIIFTGMTGHTLMSESIKGVLLAQKEYRVDKDKKSPWGISESGYYAFDSAMYYQYRAFGVPRLGLSPMHKREGVIAPYATILALMADENAANENLSHLTRIGAVGKYGYFEAIDYTDSEKNGCGCSFVESYMAHHMGMSICSINNVVNGNAIVARFMSIPELTTVELLTDEKKPQLSILIKDYERASYTSENDAKQKFRPRHITKHMKFPEGRLLTNGSYSVFVTEEGNGYSSCEDIFLTRFRRDSIRGTYGVHVCAKVDSYSFSVTPAVASKACSDAYTVFEQGCIKQQKATADITVSVRTTVSQGVNAEIRDITVINHGSSEKTVDIGVFCELCMTNASEDIAHPAFVKLTVNALQHDDMLIFERRGTRRRRAVFLFARLVSESTVRYCTDRLIMPGRQTTYQAAMHTPLLPNQPVDLPAEPGICARSFVTIAPGEARELRFVMGIAKSMDEAISDCRECSGSSFESESALLSARNASMQRFMGIAFGKAQLFEAVATRILCGITKKPQNEFCTHIGKKSLLHRFGISGDYPIILFSVADITCMRHVKTLLSLHEYLAYNYINTELVFIGEYENEYSNELKSKLYDTVLSAKFARYCSRYADNVHIVDAYDLTEAERRMLFTCAFFIIDKDISLDRQFAQGEADSYEEKPVGARHFTARRDRVRRELLFDNGTGGFDAETGEYVIYKNADSRLPLPLSNIICSTKNESQGTVVTESAGGYTWSKNAHERRLTAWYNDPIQDSSGENILICDNESMDAFTIAGGRLCGDGNVEIRHGFGYTTFLSDNYGLEQEMTVFIDDATQAKLTYLSLTNTGDCVRRLSIMYSIDWDIYEDGAVRFENGFYFVASPKFSGELLYMGIAYVGTADLEHSCNREECLCGGYSHVRLSEKTGNSAVCFTCVRISFSLDVGECVTPVLVLGICKAEDAGSVKFSAEYARKALEYTKKAWNDKLNALQVKTPSASFDILVNGRLLYQVYASRLIGRSGYYQSGGAFGFRDQLQDVLALLYTNPERAKGQLLIAASMQFERGDVMHWWHAESMRGVRTGITDDRLFLPIAVAKYCKVTCDMSVLDEKIPYVKDKKIPEGNHDIYFTAEHTLECDTMYKHCVAAIVSVLEYGAHELLLMGESDWNDGMNEVGANGGESVLLTFIAMLAIDEVLPFAKHRHDTETQKILTAARTRLKTALESNAWDGDRYLRAFYGDKTALGSAMNEECVIDLTPQVFSVFLDKKNISERARKAFYTAISLLTDDEHGLVRLLMPPFADADTEAEHFAGYVEAYLPGVRENGGQYTHAVAWAIAAACILGDAELAMKLVCYINPIEHTKTASDMQRYKAEPYALCGDVYSVGRLAGRGGWSFYTGSASILYSAVVENVLGLCKNGSKLRFCPCNTWDEYSVSYRYGDAVYDITIQKRECDEKNSDCTTKITVDGNELSTDYITLCATEGIHSVTVQINKQV